MQVTKNSVVTIDYVLRDTSGEVLDSSEGRDPLAYVHGTGALIPGLEAELEGKPAGHRFDVRVPASEGYGERDERLVHAVSRAKLPPDIELELGLELQARGPEGDMVVTVVALEGDNVTLDGNHPLAGMELCFTGEIRAVRAATAEELAHGHVHGAGGHAH